MNLPYLLEFPKIEDPRGNLSFIEGPGHVTFYIKRVFYILGNQKRLSKW